MSDLTTPEQSAAVEESPAGQALGETLAQELVERVRSDCVELVGPGGLLTGSTRTVLETALETELDEHLGYTKHAVEAATGATRVTAPARDGADRGRRGRARRAQDRDGSFEPTIVKKRSAG